MSAQEGQGNSPKQYLDERLCFQEYQLKQLTIKGDLASLLLLRCL